ncbi:hypothetical protein SAMN05444007_103449 [Cribrihabitans marinus]|uniref:Membrane-anchored ribosome-binding protein, inhibits growth in stationary phase, ElaB/YqjD/DUF883 family n=1 Tax=Cribrihabitans marinus TaxID=1227549 RepID=A0A1H6WTD2_9RHOB|nr:hypothetical protein [Cribrihabitans marinus]GGH24070.1 hypothetical protein GCM10010973_10370 [Cribrihabitans marinus]SEJ15752.1 hypothetical protein SAMN05444007_103449 [Cribrihabitans marinus]
MPTKAELEKEISQLKAKATEKVPDPRKIEVPDKDELKDGFRNLLEAQGIQPDEIEALWSDFRQQIADVPRDKPLMTAIAAFGLGFVLGRMSKS